MISKLEMLWVNISSYINHSSKYNENVVFIESRYLDFEKCVNNLSYNFKNEIMKKDVEYLDRHKMAAIIIAALIEIEAIRCKENEFQNNTLYPYEIAFSAGLSYMLFELNHYRKTKGKENILKYIFPEQMHGNTNYCNDIIKIIYHSGKNIYNCISYMSNVLFLIESYTLALLDYFLGE